MSVEWKLIFRGFSISAAGAGALMLFIVALSAAYVAKYAVASISIIAAGALAIIFRNRVGHFLDVLDQREADLSIQFAALQTEGRTYDQSDRRPMESPSRSDY